VNWKDLNKREQKNAIIGTALLAILMLYMFVFAPMWQRSEQLQIELDSANELSAYLNETQQQLSSLPNHPELSKQQVQQRINATFKSQGIKLNALIMQKDQGLVSINQTPFKPLLNSLQQLKNKYGILTTQADIKRIRDGVVSAQITLQF
jgi:type II secretory pathway component PulM